MMLSTLLTMGVLVLVLASDAGNALADETPQSDHAAVLQPCDATVSQTAPKELLFRTPTHFEYDRIRTF